jgi:hypothetical protein
MKKQLLIMSGLLGICIMNSYSQSIIQPNFALKSHETLEILRIEIMPAKTIVYLSVENRREGGYFCADRNIYMIDPEGKKLKLEESKGIPVCPETYKFKFIGEKLSFILTFPPLKSGTKWVDIVEDCNNNCFWFYGVTLDNNLNKKLDEAFSIALTGKPDDNIAVFKNILDNIDSQNLGIEGLLYLNVITIAQESGNIAKAAEWYNKLKSSGAPRTSQFIRYLNDKGIKY